MNDIDNSYDSSDILTSSNNLFNRSARMKELHALGRYKGTSKIGIWNSSDEKRERMKLIREKNSLDKNSRGYGSEYHMRIANRTLLHNKFQGAEGYMYFLVFPNSIKVGFSKDWERRTTQQILGGRVVLIISGPTNDLADLEFDTLNEFKQYTQLNAAGTRYTEFLNLSQKNKVYDYLKKKVQEIPSLKIEIENKL